MAERRWTGTEGVALGPSGSIAGIEWNLRRLEALAVRLPPENRLIRAQRLLERLNDGAIVLDPNDDALLARVTEAHWSAFQQHVICRATANPNGISDTHREKLELMLGGADLPELDSNSIARDTQFELYAGAMLSMGGAPVILAEPDLRVLIAGQELGFAAKRVKNPKQLKKRVKGAVEQITRAGGRGVVAVCVDLLVKDTGLPGSAVERGAAFDERTQGLHELDDWLVTQPAVVGRMALGHDSVWHFDRGRPGLEAALFRQYRLFPRSEAEEAALKSSFETVEEVIRQRLPNL